MGFALCWLVCNRQGSHADHLSFRPSPVERRVHRVAGRAEYDADWRKFEAAERPRRDGEDSEPEHDPSAF
eukprot:373708-Pyramimonas_sp.AAC.1